MLKLIKKALIKILVAGAAVAAPAAAFAQDAAASCDYASCMACFAGENPIKAGLAIVAGIVMMVFAFRKKSLPQWAKDIIASYLGRKPSNP